MPARLLMTSGDPLADRRYDYARDLERRGELVAAADLLVQATDLAPGFAAAWFKLADLREQLSERDEAIEAYRRAQATDPQDRNGAGLRLMAMGAAPLSAMSSSYVRTLFDQYASTFETSLVGDLGYRGPSLLLDAVRSTRHAIARPAAFKFAIDLGCGTGLAAQAFAPDVDSLLGIDLSPLMIEQARATGLYARLVVADMTQGLCAEADASADLIVAADALVYLHDLAPLLREAARVMMTAATLAFTVETHSGDGLILREGLRYAHAATYVRSALGAAGLAVSHLADCSTRNEKHAPVPGLVVVATRA